MLYSLPPRLSKCQVSAGGNIGCHNQGGVTIRASIYSMSCTCMVTNSKMACGRRGVNAICQFTSIVIGHLEPFRPCNTSMAGSQSMAILEWPVSLSAK